MDLPQDPVILLSYVNTKLRDEYDTLAALCESEDVSQEEIVKKLAQIGYVYAPENNRFV